MQRSVVVLPQPLGPSNVSSWPRRASSRLMAAAVTVPYDLHNS
jgi:hypothetical protein